MATKDEELHNEVLKEAIAGTEREIWDDSVGTNPDHVDATNDRSVEEMGTGLEGQQEDDDADTETETVEAKGKEGEEENADDAEGKKDDEKGDDQDRDPKTGKFKAKDKDGEKDEGADGEAEGQQSEESREQPNQRIPLKTHIEQRNALRTAERERDELKTQLETKDTTHRNEIQALNSRLDNIMVAISKGQNVQNGQVEGEDSGEPTLADLLITDPGKYHERIVADVTSTLQKQFVGNNIAAAVEDDEDGSFRKAYDALIDPAKKSDPQHVAVVQEVYRSGNPSARIMKWWKGEQDRQALSKETLAERDERITREAFEKAASDPEFRKKYMPGKGGQQREQQAEEGQQEAQQQSGARHVVKLPKSLNGASGGQGGGGSPAFNSGGRDKDIFDDVMSGG